MLDIYTNIPAGLLDCDATQLHTVLKGPALIKLAGKREDILFISVLLHGNETTGWEAVRTLLSRYQMQALPRSLSIYIGNIAAARESQRCLPHQPDYNRIWKAEGTLPEHDMVRALFSELEGKPLFAAVDVHNNTGKNPHYACVNRLESRFLHIARLFSRTVVYFIRPDTVMSMAMASRCPAVTIECGLPGEAKGVLHVLEFLDACLHLSEYPEHDIPAQDLDLFHTVATVKIAGNAHIGIADWSADFSLLPDMDKLNFNEIPAGSLFGWANGLDALPLLAWDEQGREIGRRYFEVQQNEIITMMPVMPSMLTLDLNIIKQDCLCYLMERLSVN
ncbi:MAG: M14 family metallopeptidase [Gammaproteobacteria bacterium]|nr:M14 family metallopeptidase [Gammaproteobacteria bacterium]